VCVPLRNVGGGRGLLKKVLVGQTRAGAGVRCEKPKASFAARFWSTVWAMPYQPSGSVSEGLLVTIVAMAF
jgi:hypothetical protein